MRYPSKTLVKNITPVSRTVSQANRDAQYALAISTYKTDFKLTLDFAINAIWGAIIVSAIVAPFAIGFWIWSNQS